MGLWYHEGPQGITSRSQLERRLELLCDSNSVPEHCGVDHADVDKGVCHVAVYNMTG